MTLQGHYEVVLLLGAPGAGKGTQALSLAESLGVLHVASGDLLREHRRLRTTLGAAAKVYMDRGDLVPDDLVVDMVMDRLDQEDAARGALLDGFPRTLAQAEALDQKLAAHGGSVRSAVYLYVPADVLVERLAGRWICKNCQATYHALFNRWKVDMICDVCGGPLFQRSDDTREVVGKRVSVFLRETEPVVDHYRTLGVLHEVNGNGTIAAIRAALSSVVARDAPPALSLQH